MVTWNEDATSRFIAENVSDVIIAIDTSDRIVFANPAVEAVFGYTREQLLELPFTDLIPEHLRESHRLGLQRYLVTDERNISWSGVELLGLHKSGREIPLEISFSEFYQDGQRLFAGIIRDISQRKQAAEELERKARQQAALAELGLFTLEGPDLPTLMEEATHVVGTMLEVELCKVQKLLPGGKSLLLQSGIGWHEGLVGRAEVGAGPDSQAGYTLLVDEPVVVHDLSTETRFSGPPLLHEHGVTSGITVVINTPRGPYGVMGVHTREKRSFSRDETNFLQAVANVLGEGVRRQRAEEALLESEQRYRSIFDTAAVGVARVGNDGYFLEVNKCLCQELGYSREELLSRTFRDITDDIDLEEIVGVAQRMMRGEIDHHRMEKRYVHKDGSKFWAHLTLSTEKNAEGEHLYFTAIIKNIDARKEAEIALKKHAERLSEANRELELFNYSISHDLRTPLRGIDGFSKVLLEDYGERLDDAGRRHMQRVRAGAQRIGDLIDALLALSRLTRSDIRHEDVDLSEFARSIAEELKDRQPERYFIILVEDGVRASGDPRLLWVALENLLENAWKFTRDQEQARIEFGVREVNGKDAYFVQDNGIGFDMRYADRLFGAFQRLHPEDRFEGLGMGLVTVQRVIHRHGGKVWTEAEVGKGAAFYFTL